MTTGHTCSPEKPTKNHKNPIFPFNFTTCFGIIFVDLVNTFHETASGKHILGKGLLVVGEAGECHVA